ncbi:uncharacterized protein LOC141648874 [Silene latifolia]|uniref:uncharacterized protein LOC141648874 n=1 Tax=Silene latifolia TaxID=37657 RepID=UPI003D772816
MVAIIGAGLHSELRLLILDSVMDFEDPKFLNSLCEALRNLHERDARWQPRRGEPQLPVDEFKVTELPEFEGSTDSEDYLEWERKMDRMFEFKMSLTTNDVSIAILKLIKTASFWFENLKDRRQREGKQKLKSWEDLKKKMRKKYVPVTYKIDLYKRIAELAQDSLSIKSYIAEFEKLTMMGEIEEIEEQRMARFFRGLNHNIAHVVELQSYSNFDTLCNLCLRVEAWQKNSRPGASTSSRASAWGKFDAQKQIATNPSVNVGAKTATPMNSREQSEAKGKDRDFSKLHCFKCQGFRHFQSDCPNKRIITLREAVSVWDELYDKMIEEEGLFIVNDEEEDTEESLIFDAPIYDTNLVLRRMLHSEVETKDEAQRDQIYHTKCQFKDRWCTVIVDSGSCTNVASTMLVDKLALSTLLHPIPYTLHWLDDGNKVKVTKQVRVNFVIGPYRDEILCDVIPMDACHLLLGRSWQFDRSVVHDGRSNELTLVLEGKKATLRPMAPAAMRPVHSGTNKKMGLSLFASEREVEQAIHNGDRVLALLARENLRALQGTVPSKGLEQLLDEFSDVFPEDLPTGLPPIRGIEHQIDLIPGAPLPNKAAHRSNPEETRDLQRQIEELLERGYVRESLSPCAVPVLLVPKKDGSWHMCIDSRAVNNITIKYRFPIPRLDDMLDELHGSKIFSKAEKCSFLVEEVIFLGYVVSKDGVSVDKNKVEAIRTWPVPSTVTEKGAFKWDGAAQKAFELIKKKLCEAPFLALPDFSQPFEVKWDDSGVGIGAVYKEGRNNVVADSLSRRYALLSTLEVRLLGFEILKEYYPGDGDFREIFKERGTSTGTTREYTRQDGFLFRGNRHCIPKHSIRELLVREAHGGGIAGHFGSQKTLEVLKEHFYWPKMLGDIQDLLLVYGINRYLPLDLLPLSREELIRRDAESKLKAILKLHEQVKKQIEKVNAAYKERSNKYRKPRIFSPGDLAWLHLRKERFPGKRKNKLMPHAEGPYKIIEKINDNAYKLELPGDYSVHATFNGGDLSPYFDDDGLAELRAIPSQEGGDDTSTVDEVILNSVQGEGSNPRPVDMVAVGPYSLYI